MAAKGFSWSSFLVRWLGVAFTVFATYNPSGYSFWHWATASWGEWTLKYFAGILLFTAYVVYFRFTVRSIGWFGMSLVVAIVVGLAWVLVDHDWIDLGMPGVLPAIVLAIVVTVFAVGLSWSHVRTRLSGQVDSNPVH
ncbi:MAG: hypothetical protein OHK0024_18410 [Thalassobaculales bacterium]